MRPSLGEFEHQVMIAVRNSGDEAYGLQVAKRLLEKYGGSLAIAQVYVTLQRLVSKGLLSSYVDAPRPIRGGRARRIFKIEEAGVQALEQSTAFRHALLGSENKETQRDAYPQDESRRVCTQQRGGKVREAFL